VLSFKIFKPFSVYSGGEDYKFEPYNVTFPAGVTAKSLNVTIVDDNILENNETFNLRISSQLPNRVNLNNTNQITVTIEDNDGEYN